MGRCLLQGSVRAAVLVLFAALTACGSFQDTFTTVMKGEHRVLRWHKSAADDLIKKVGIHRVVNRSGLIAEDFETVQTDRLVELLQAETDALTIVGPDSRTGAGLLERLPRTAQGAVDNLEVARQARKAGFNAVVVAELVDVSDRRREKGYWWFKSVYRNLEATLDVAVYDSQTAAKIMYERFSHEFETDMPLSESGQEPATTLPPRVIKEIEEKVWPVAVSRIVDATVAIPWVGFIRRISRAGVAVTADQETGLELGDVLEVLDKDRVIEGLEGARFLVPGSVIGTLEVVSVSSRGVETRMLSGVRWFTPGLQVRLASD